MLHVLKAKRVSEKERKRVSEKERKRERERENILKMHKHERAWKGIVKQKCFPNWPNHDTKSSM